MSTSSLIGVFVLVVLVAVAPESVFGQTDPRPQSSQPDDSNVLILYMGRKVDLNQPSLDYSVNLDLLEEHKQSDFYRLVKKLITNREKQSLLEITDEQFRGLKGAHDSYVSDASEIWNKASQRLEELRSKVEESSSETAKRDLADYFSSIQEKVVKRFESLKAEVNDALVPHQMDEVNQEVAKMALKRQLPFKCDYLASPYLLSFDERISEEVRAKIRAATKREVEKHKEEIDNAISNTQRKVLELFPKELRSSVEVILNSQDKRTFVQPAEGAENGD